MLWLWSFKAQFFNTPENSISNIILPLCSPSWRCQGWCPRGPAPAQWSETRGARVRGPGGSWAWREDDLSAPWDCPSWPPPWSCRRPGTSGTCRTGSGSSSACPRGSSCPPDTRTWRSSAPSSWRTPCSPRRSAPRSAGTRRGPRTRRTPARRRRRRSQSWPRPRAAKRGLVRGFWAGLVTFYRDWLAADRAFNQWHFWSSKDDLVTGTPKHFAKLENLKIADIYYQHTKFCDR